MTKQKKNIIGHDPLAWISIDDEDEVSEGKKSLGANSKQQTASNSEAHPFGIDVGAFLLGYGLIQDNLTDIVSDFYKTLFLTHSEVKLLFENSDTEEQQQKLARAISLLADNINDVDKLLTVLSGLGERHQQYGAVTEHFNAVNVTLLSTIKTHIGRKWTKKISASWEVVLDRAAEAMLSAYTDESELSPSDAEPESTEPVEVINDQNNDTEQASNEEGVLYLAASQDISTVEELLDRIKSGIDVGLVNINISNVTRIDASCLQILYLLFRDADIYGYETKIKGSSEAFDRSVHLLGMSNVLKVAV